MKFNFEVGEKEKHNIEFDFNKFWGTIKFRVDGDVKEKLMRVLLYLKRL